MTFANPLALLWALLAVPIVLLYRRRIPLRREAVATEMIWQQVFAEERARDAWQPWRHSVSLAVQLTILLLLVLAMAEPLIPGPRRTVLVVDNSAGMNATDVAPSRLEQVKQAALRMVEGLRDCDQMAVLTAGDAMAVRSTLSGDQDALREVIEAIPATEGTTHVTAAVDLARRMLSGRKRDKIVVLSDARFDDPDKLAAAEDVELVRIGTSAGNVAVSRLQTRRGIGDPRRCQVLAEVRNFSDGPVACGLEISLDGETVDTVPLDLPADGRWQQVFEMTTASSGTLTAKLDRDDALSADNRASAAVAPAGQHRVMLVTEGNPMLKSVFEANPAVELTVADRPPESSTAGTIIVYDRQFPNPLPGGPLMVIDPAGSSDLWQLGAALEDPTIAEQSDTASLMSDVRLLGIRLPEARRVELSAGVESTAIRLASAADRAALYIAIDRPAGRVLVLSGNLSESSLPLRSAFPIMMTNALGWLAGIDRGDEFSPSLADGPLLQESDLRVPAGPGIQLSELKLRRPGLPPWVYLTVVALGLLVSEWCLYQRRWMS